VRFLTCEAAARCFASLAPPPRLYIALSSNLHHASLCIHFLANFLCTRPPRTATCDAVGCLGPGGCDAAHTARWDDAGDVLLIRTPARLQIYPRALEDKCIDRAARARKDRAAIGRRADPLLLGNLRAQPRPLSPRPRGSRAPGLTT